jgi:HlyD family secretion protein
MNASADIKTRRTDNAIAVPITAVAARVKGSDESLEDKKRETKREDTDEATPAASLDELEEVIFVLKEDNKVEKRVVNTGIQDINYIQVVNGLKEGEQVVTAPYNAISKTLKSGTKVTVVSKEKLFEK